MGRVKESFQDSRLSWSPVLFCVSKWALCLIKMSSLCVAECLYYIGKIARRAWVFAQWAITHYWPGDQRRSKETKNREADGWKRLKERIVGANRRGREKGDGSEEGNWGLRGVGDRMVAGVWKRGRKIRVKRACLLWQSPRPSVLPCSTSCSKADLQGTETPWSAAENLPHLTQSYRKAITKTTLNMAYSMLAYSITCRKSYPGSKSKNRYCRTCWKEKLIKEKMYVSFGSYAVCCCVVWKKLFDIPMLSWHEIYTLLKGKWEATTQHKYLDNTLLAQLQAQVSPPLTTFVQL